jgi:hypothetical protein
MSGTKNTKPQKSNPPVKRLPQQQPQPQQPQPIGYTLTPEALQELVQCVNECVGSRFVKQTLFNAINGTVIPVMPVDPEKEK